MGFEWTPQYTFVNLILNNDYKGFYVLTEQVEKGPQKINISNKGFIIEKDAYWWLNEVSFRAHNNNLMPTAYTYKYPDEKDVTVLENQYIQNYVSQAEASLTQDTYTKYIDEESFVNWIIVHDLLGTFDAGGSNIFVTKHDQKDNSKLKMATPWDFDTNYGTPNQWAMIHNVNNFYYYKLFTNPKFVLAYKTRWDEIKDTIKDKIFTELDNFYNQYGQAINQGRYYDCKRWRYAYKSTEEEIKEIKSWFEQRINWINENISKL